MILILRETLFFCLRFLSGRALAILKTIALPGLAGCAMLYLLLSSYCSQLLDYLGHPSDGVAGRVLGIVAMGLLIMLLLHAIVVAALAGLLLERKDAQPSFLGIRANAWHIYTANLRLLLALGAAAMVFWLVVFALKRVWILPDGDFIRPLLFAILFCLAVRLWFFVAPACVVDHDVGSVTMAWRRSAGHFWVIAVVMFVIFIGSIIFQVVLEVALHAVGGMRSFSHPGTIAQAVVFYRENLLPTVVLISVTYLVATVLLTAARFHLYRRFADVASQA